MQKEMLTKCEEEVMAIIWENHENLDLQEITSKANNRYGKDWKQQTVSTFLARIVAKKYLEMYRGGRVFFYNPLVDKEEYLTEKLADISKKFDVSKEYLISLL